MVNPHFFFEGNATLLKDVYFPVFSITKPGRPESAIQDRTTPVDHRTAGGLATFERRFPSQKAHF